MKPIITLCGQNVQCFNATASLRIIIAVTIEVTAVL